MNFKNFVRDVWRPLQQQAKAKGLNPADVDISGALKSYISPQAMGEVQGEMLGLEKRRLGMLEKGMKQAKKLAPWSIGLGAANIGLTGLMGMEDIKQAELQRKRQQQYIDEIRNMRGLISK